MTVLWEWDSEYAPTLFCPCQVATRLVVFPRRVEYWLSKLWGWGGWIGIGQNKMSHSLLVLWFSHFSWISSSKIAASLWLFSRVLKMLTLTILPVFLLILWRRFLMSLFWCFLLTSFEFWEFLDFRYESVVWKHFLQIWHLKKIILTGLSQSKIFSFMKSNLLSLSCYAPAFSVISKNFF